MDDREYDALPGVRFTRLSRMSVSALEFTVQDDRDSSALRVGRALHCLVLELEAYPGRFAVKPEGMRFSSKEGKAWETEHLGFEILAHAEAARAHCMSQALPSNATFARALADAAAIEVPVQWTDDASGVACKCKPDLVTNGGAMWEIKTTRLKSLRQLHAEIGRRLYHAQLAFYSTPFRADVREHWIAFVQNVEPHDVIPVRVPSLAIDAGRAMAARWLAELAACRARGRWPGLTGEREFIEAEVPDWALGDAVEIDMEGLADGD